MRQFLTLRGWSRYDVYFEVSPAGKGSAEQWVREQFPQELRRHRAKHPRSGLVVVIDADTSDVVERIRGLEKACDDQSVERRGPDEPVLFVIPKRNIETWLAYLKGQAVNEDDEYAKYDLPSNCRHELERLHEMCQRDHLQEPAPPSLTRCCIEFENFWCLIQ